MADLGRAHADMPMAGRTHGQHAVPATFGYKVAVWIDELMRHVERLQRGARRACSSPCWAAAPAPIASLGEQGPPVQAGIGRLLGFGSMPVPSRAIGDHLAENICLLGLLAATCGKIGREIYTLMKTEFGEVEEPVPPGTVGSSTMPQKRNPKLCQDIIAAAAEVRALVPLALEAMKTEHEADRTTSLMMDAAEARALHRHGRHAGPARRGAARAAGRSRADARQPRPRRRPDHGRGGDARPRARRSAGSTRTTSSTTPRRPPSSKASRSPTCSAPTSA